MIKMLKKNTLPTIGGLILPLMMSLTADAGQGKLLATAGLVQLEGSGGGGIVPWATLAGYDSRDETSLTVFGTQVDVDDYQLNSWGAAVSLYDRVELSVARQDFELSQSGAEIRQNIIGIKVRLYGDVVYSPWPQVSAGIQHKRLLDPAIAQAVGADSSDHGTDYYLAMTKVHLGAAAGYNVVWNVAGRFTKANQMGLLGYGGKHNNHQLMLEASLGVLLSKHWVVGVEYRQKPNNLALREDDWKDVFISYVPSKALNLTLAWADLGEIAGERNQQGLYLSFSGQLW